MKFLMSNVMFIKTMWQRQSIGVKGAGEAGINAVGAAVASAIDNALMSKKTFIDELPITPDKIRQKMLETV